MADLILKNIETKTPKKIVESFNYSSYKR